MNCCGRQWTPPAPLAVWVNASTAHRAPGWGIAALGSGSGGGAFDTVQQAVAACTVGEVRYVVGAGSDVGEDLLVGVSHWVPGLRPGGGDVGQGRVGSRHRELRECGAVV